MSDFLEWLEAEGIEVAPRVVTCTRFASRARPVGAPDALDLAAFVACPLVHTGEKGVLPLVSFATFQGHARALANVLEVSALVADVDEPTSPETVFAALETVGTRAHAHSTFSATADAWKWRVVFETDRHMTAPEHRAAWGVLARALARCGVACDRAVRDASRAFYVPAQRPGAPYLYRSHEGAPLAVADLLALADELARREAAPAPQRSRVASSTPATERARAYARAVPGAVAGQHGHRVTFLLAVRLVRGFGLSDDEALAVLEEWNASCRPPWRARDLARKVAQARHAAQLPDGFMLERGAA
ncbi:MAG: hypothetical protein U0183_01215 [Polyangiaceae bacterium]